MDVHQDLRQLLQHAHAHGLVARETAGAPAPGNGAAQQQTVVFIGDVLRVQDGAHGVVHPEFGFHHAALPGGAHHRGGIGLSAQNQRQGTQEDGFTGAGLSAYNAEALWK